MTVPSVYPLPVGVKVTGSSTLAPGWIFIGTGKLPRENALPCRDLEVMCKRLFPVFEIWME